MKSLVPQTCPNLPIVIPSLSNHRTSKQRVSRRTESASVLPPTISCSVNDCSVDILGASPSSFHSTVIAPVPGIEAPGAGEVICGAAKAPAASAAASRAEWSMASISDARSWAAVSFVKSRVMRRCVYPELCASLRCGLGGLLNGGVCESESLRAGCFQVRFRAFRVAPTVWGKWESIATTGLGSSS